MIELKIAINGFGRIGRLAFRQMFNLEGVEVVAINDLTGPDMLAYLLKYDSCQKQYELRNRIESTDNSIIVDGKEIRVYSEQDARKENAARRLSLCLQRSALRTSNRANEDR